MIEMAWDRYEKLVKENIPEYVELAKLYAASKEELVDNFRIYCNRSEKMDMLHQFINNKIEVDFVGEGYYDLCGFSYGVAMIMRIDDTMRTQF